MLQHNLFFMDSLTEHELCSFIAEHYGATIKEVYKYLSFHTPQETVRYFTPLDYESFLELALR